MKNGKFYFIKDEFLEKYDLMQNKGPGHSRPFFCSFEDPTNPGIYWMTPISSQITKYEQQFEHKLEAYGKCDTVDFVYLKNHKNAAVIKSTFPILSKYVDQEYQNNKRAFELKPKELTRIQAKIERLMRLQSIGHNYFYYDIYSMRDDLIHELQLDNIPRHSQCNTINDQEDDLQDLEDSEEIFESTCISL